jgi:hypothetical protein
LSRRRFHSSKSWKKFFGKGDLEFSKTDNYFVGENERKEE